MLLYVCIYYIYNAFIIYNVFPGTSWKNNVKVWQGEHAATLFATGMLHTILSVHVTEDVPAGGQVFADYGDAFWAETKVDLHGLHLVSIFHILCYIICMRVHLYIYRYIRINVYQ